LNREGELEDEAAQRGDWKAGTPRIAETLGIIPGGSDQSYSQRGNLIRTQLRCCSGKSRFLEFVGERHPFRAEPKAAPLRSGRPLPDVTPSRTLPRADRSAGRYKRPSATTEPHCVSLTASNRGCRRSRRVGAPNAVVQKHGVGAVVLTSNRAPTRSAGLRSPIAVNPRSPLAKAELRSPPVAAAGGAAPPARRRRSWPRPANGKSCRVADRRCCRSCAGHRPDRTADRGALQCAVSTVVADNGASQGTECPAGDGALLSVGAGADTAGAKRGERGGENERGRNFHHAFGPVLPDSGSLTRSSSATQRRCGPESVIRRARPVAPRPNRRPGARAVAGRRGSIRDKKARDGALSFE